MLGLRLLRTISSRMNSPELGRVKVVPVKMGHLEHAQYIKTSHEVKTADTLSRCAKNLKLK